MTKYPQRRVPAGRRSELVRELLASAHGGRPLCIAPPACDTWMCGRVCKSDTPPIPPPTDGEQP